MDIIGVDSLTKIADADATGAQLFLLVVRHEDITLKSQKYNALPAKSNVRAFPLREL